MLNWYVYVSLIMLIVLLIIGLPIPLVMFGTTLFLVIFGGYSIDMLFPNAYTRLNSMTMVAFPLFIIAGGFIERGGIGEHLVNFVNLLLGRVKGGLAMMMSVCCGIFGAISGSSFAAETVIGELMIPRMNKAGLRHGDIFVAAGIHLYAWLVYPTQRHDARVLLADQPTAAGLLPRHDDPRHRDDDCFLRLELLQVQEGPQYHH